MTIYEDIADEIYDILFPIIDEQTTDDTLFNIDSDESIRKSLENAIKHSKKLYDSYESGIPLTPCQLQTVLELVLNQYNDTYISKNIKNAVELYRQLPDDMRLDVIGNIVSLLSEYYLTVVEKQIETQIYQTINMLSVGMPNNHAIREYLDSLTEFKHYVDNKNLDPSELKALLRSIGFSNDTAELLSKAYALGSEYGELDWFYNELGKELDESIHDLEDMHAENAEY